MNARMFMEAMEEIGTAYVEEAICYKRKRRGSLSGSRLWRTAAAACLAVLLLFGAVIAVSPQVRAAVLGWVKDLSMGYGRYYFAGEEVPQPERLTYRITAVPDGYVELERSETDFAAMAIYCEKETGRYLNFQCTFGEGGTVNVSGDCVVTPVTVRGVTGDFYRSQDPEYNNCMVWSEEDLLFLISGYFDQEAMIEIAESIAP